MINDLDDDNLPPAVIEQVVICREVVKVPTIADIEPIVMGAQRLSLANLTGEFPAGFEFCWSGRPRRMLAHCSPGLIL
jgi:hypothetical protein